MGQGRSTQGTFLYHKGLKNKIPTMRFIMKNKINAQIAEIITHLDQWNFFLLISIIIDGINANRSKAPIIINITIIISKIKPKIFIVE